MESGKTARNDIPLQEMMASNRPALCLPLIWKTPCQGYASVSQRRCLLMESLPGNPVNDRISERDMPMSFKI